MSKTATDERQQLAALGLNPDAPGLSQAADDVDPRTMPVSDIVFDPSLLDDFPSLEGEGMAAASRHVFNLYKSYGRNKDRNRRLHDEIGLFIQRVRRSRQSDTTHVKDKVRTSKDGRDLLALLAERGIHSVTDLQNL